MHIECRWGSMGECQSYRSIMSKGDEVTTLYSEHWMAWGEWIANYSHDKMYCFASWLLTHWIPVEGLALCDTLPVPVGDMARLWWAIRTKPPTSKFASSKYRPIWTTIWSFDLKLWFEALTWSLNLKPWFEVSLETPSLPTLIDHEWWSK